ncbi:hypothetical protein Q8A67_017673 [Cirrhinus molitorella]|uniref:Peptidase M12A domain-containing protein n=1 Tax=Cirrhinus molitorella TaxID=172907 RepID=A0AA88TRX1_9TELE|nr:hypothetical protein Q8A67_017673 [Cirrhinus molitorella]
MGKEHNFNKYKDDLITDLNTPYNYESIMHYRPLSRIPTITTTIPAFNNILGQRLDFSALDLERLNRMYECRDGDDSWKIAFHLFSDVASWWNKSSTFEEWDGSCLCFRGPEVQSLAGAHSSHTISSTGETSSRTTT